jgi:hypothetical protein
MHCRLSLEGQTLTSNCSISSRLSTDGNANTNRMCGRCGLLLLPLLLLSSPPAAALLALPLPVLLLLGSLLRSSPLVSSLLIRADLKLLRAKALAMAGSVLSNS